MSTNQKHGASSVEGILSWLCDFVGRVDGAGRVLEAPSVGTSEGRGLGGRSRTAADGRFVIALVTLRYGGSTGRPSIVPWSGPASLRAPLLLAFGSPDDRSAGAPSFGLSWPSVPRTFLGGARVRRTWRGGAWGLLREARIDVAVVCGPFHPPGARRSDALFGALGQRVPFSSPTPRGPGLPSGFSARAGLCQTRVDAPSFWAALLRPVSRSAASSLRAGLHQVLATPRLSGGGDVTGALSAGAGGAPHPWKVFRQMPRSFTARPTDSVPAGAPLGLRLSGCSAR